MILLDKSVTENLVAREKIQGVYYTLFIFLGVVHLSVLRQPFELQLWLSILFLGFSLRLLYSRRRGYLAILSGL